MVPRLFSLLSFFFLASFGDLWLGSGSGSERLLSSSSFVSSIALTSISPMSRRSSLEVVVLKIPHFKDSRF